MPKPLSAAAVTALTRRGCHRVSDNLYLQIAEGNTRAWICRYQLDGRQRHMGLGSAKLITLAEARTKTRDALRLLLDGIDPIEQRKRTRRARLVEAAHSRTFKECATAYVASHEAGWRNRQSHAQWTQSLRDYVYPHLGDVAVSDVDTTLVLATLEPIWKTKPETASRVRGRIEAVLDWAKARGYRNGAENPARWRGHLDNLLPARSKVKRVEHFAALDYRALPDFMAELRAKDDVPARMLEFLILTAARSGEVFGAKRSEVDGNVWTVPAARMKSEKEHRVPLSSRAIELLTALPREAEYVFVGARTGSAASPHVMARLLRRMKCPVTVHGFRSAFRDWAAETTAFPNHVVEQALAHAIPSGVEAAYRRGDLFEKRRELMAAWANYCMGGNHDN